MTPADRVVLDALHHHMTDVAYAYVVSEVEKAGSLLAIRDTTALIELAKAKRSFGGDRSAAGQYAARVRWGRSGGDSLSSTDHGLKTTKPVQRNPDGTLMVQGDNGGWRPPTAAERGLPTGTEFKQDIKQEMDELASITVVDARREILNYDAVRLKQQVTTSVRALNKFHREHDAQQGYGTDRSATSAHSQRGNFDSAFTRVSEWFGSALGGRGGSADPKVKSLADRIAAKMQPISDLLASLQEPAK